VLAFLPQVVLVLGLYPAFGYFLPLASTPLLSSSNPCSSSLVFFPPRRLVSFFLFHVLHMFCRNSASICLLLFGSSGWFFPFSPTLPICLQCLLPPLSTFPPSLKSPDIPSRFKSPSSLSFQFFPSLIPSPPGFRALKIRCCYVSPICFFFFSFPFFPSPFVVFPLFVFFSGLPPLLPL